MGSKTRGMRRRSRIQERRWQRGTWEIDQEVHVHLKEAELEEQAVDRTVFEFNTSRITMLKEFYKIKPLVRE